jgi:hypothetical protein
MPTPSVLKAALARLADDDRAKLQQSLLAKSRGKASRSVAGGSVPAWAWPTDEMKRADIRRLGRQPYWECAEPDDDPLAAWDA